MKNIFKNSIFTAFITKAVLLFAVLMAAIVTIGGAQTIPHSQKSDASEQGSPSATGQSIPQGVTVPDIGGNQTVPRDYKSESVVSKGLYHDYY